MSTSTNEAVNAEAFPDHPMAVSILVVEDEEVSREFMIKSLRRKGYDVQSVGGADELRARLTRATFDLVVTNLQAPGMNGLEVLKEIKEISPETEIVVTSDAEKRKRALQAIKAGAHGYLIRPFQPEDLNLAAEQALTKKRLVGRIHTLEEELRNHHPLQNIVWASRAMDEVLKTVRQVARLESTVLISGESGTGKELVARILHCLSPREARPLIVISCEAIPESLQESEIFGHVKDSFPGANRDKRGMLEEAHGGTVFLDEVAGLCPTAQVRLMRFLQDGEVTPVGASTGRTLDVRILASTKQNLEELVEQNAFREDLYYRLNVVPVLLPPLRERQEDVPILTQRFVKIASERMGRSNPPNISPRVMNLFLNQAWRGNVRELECSVERAVALDRDGIIGMDDLPLGEPQNSEDRVLDRARQDCLNLSELEREYILEVLSENNGSRKRTAERLGITTATLWRKLKQYENQPKSDNGSESD
jgi:DNA-binding NtrC family response regulator